MKKGIRVLTVKETDVVAKKIEKKISDWNKRIKKNL